MPAIWGSRGAGRLGGEWSCSGHLHLAYLFSGEAGDLFLQLALEDEIFEMQLRIVPGFIRDERDRLPQPSDR